MTDHHHDHDDPHAPIEEQAGPPTPHELLEHALRELLVEKGIFQAGDVQAYIENMELRTPAQGARMVAKIWNDPAYRRLALEDGKAAATALDIDVSVAPELVILENTPERHYVVVCTLCSCYPWPMLGLPPSWYKSPQYRSRLVAQPRAVLAEMGLELPAEVRIRVWDSSAVARYLVVPERPSGTDRLSEAELARLVTRDSMIGVGRALSPGDG
jgi:nitrile hydratase